MSTDDTEQKAAPDVAADAAATKPRKVQRSISTTGRAGFSSTEPRPEGEKVKWDMRAERPAPGEGAPPSARPRRRPPTGDVPRDMGAPRRVGASGGRAMPEMPQRGPVDRNSADFVDRWLSQKPRPPQERPPFGGPRDGRPGRPDRRDGRPGRDARPDGQRHGDRPLDARAKAPVEAPRREEPKKLPDLHETILVGLPRVSTEARAAASAKPKTAKEALLAKAAAGQKPAPAAEKREAAPARAIDPSWTSAGADGAVAALRAASDLADKVVDAWLGANNVAAIAEAGQSDDLSGAARKASRRALSVLKARGVSIPAPLAKATRSQAAAASTEVVEATFTPPDARGTSSYTIAIRQGTDRAHIAEVIVRDEVGVIQAVSGWMSRSQIKEAHQRVADGAGVAPVQVPADWVRHRVAEAKKKNQTSQVLLPLGLEKCKEIIEPVPSAAPAHPLVELEGALAEGIPEGASLHGEPEFRAWLPEAAALDELIRNVGQALSQEEAQDPKKVDDVLKAEIKSATDRYFTPEVRERVADRMRDAAISVRARGGDDRARDVLRTARAVRSAGLITSPPSDIEFLESFFQKGVALMAQRGGGSVRVPTRA